MADLMQDLVVTATAEHLGVIAVGYFQTEGDQGSFVVVRFHPNGALDPTFGQAGVVTVKVGTCDDQAVDVAVQQDGKTVVVGTSFDFGRGSQITALRFLPDGTPDRGFGIEGRVTVRLGSGYDQAEALEVGADGTLRIRAESGLDHRKRTLVLGPGGEPLFPVPPVLPWGHGSRLSPP